MSIHKIRNSHEHDELKKQQQYTKNMIYCMPRTFINS